VATVLLPRSLLDLFPGAERRQTVDGETVDAIVRELDARVPGLRERLVGPSDTVHVIPAVSGG